MSIKHMPSFGVLEGLKVIHATQSVAGPYAAQLMADWGADVTWIESPLSPDIARSGGGWAAEQDRRNQRTISLNIPDPEGKQVFLNMIKHTDIFLESSRGGQYLKWGLTDEKLWEQNPKLIIVHISGFGQEGDERYVNRASYDPIAQAFGGLMEINGFPDRPPIPAFPVMADYITGFFAISSALAALYRVQTTGKGESIDLAQFEAVIRSQGNFPIDYLNTGKLPEREGNHSATAAGYGSYTCKDEKEVYMLFLGGGVLQNGLPVLGLEYGTDLFPSGFPVVMLDSRAGEILEDKIKAFCSERSAKEVEKALNAAGVPCSKIMNYRDAADHPHYISRNVFTEWKKVDGSSVKGVNVIPKFKNNPGKVWRGSPTIGMDNDEILKEFGYSASEIELFYEKGIIKKS